MSNPRIVSLKDIASKPNDDSDSEDKPIYNTGSSGTMVEGDKKDGKKDDKMRPEQETFIADAPPAIQNLLRRSIQQQQAAGPSSGPKPPSAESETPSLPVFVGEGRTYGGAVVKDKSAKKKTEKEADKTVERRVVFYKNGFVIFGSAGANGDGATAPVNASEDQDAQLEEFHSYNDPESDEFINNITNGYAPLKALHVKRNQKVSLSVDYKHGEEYRPSQRPASQAPRLFSGAGQTLGSGDASHSKKIVEAAAASCTTADKPFPFDDSKPKANIQVRCIDGKRLTMTVNLCTKLSQIYDFVGDCTAMKTKYFILVSTLVPHLEDVHNLKRTVEELSIENSVLIQRPAPK